MLPIGMLLEVGGKILDKVIPDPEAKAKAQAALMEMQQKGELAQQLNVGFVCVHAKRGHRRKHKIARQND